MPNPRHIICQFCEVIIIPEMHATKVRNEVNLVKSTMRDYDFCGAYWHVDKLTSFQNVEVHQLDSSLKYLCCLSC